MNEEKKPFVTPSEFAEAVTVSIPTAYRLIYSGAIPSFKFGGSVRIAREDLKTYIAQSKRQICKK
jgi:excisionase family DNA binding protein